MFPDILKTKHFRPVVTLAFCALSIALAAPYAVADSHDSEETITSATPFGDDALLQGLAPDGWHLGTTIEHYNVASMYNKINGRSELYMAYDVRGLSWATFSPDNESGRFIDVFAYDMRSVEGAFGIYAIERETNQPPIDIGREGYLTDGNHYFWVGNWYIYVQSSKEDEFGTSAGYAVAKALAARIPDSGKPVSGLDLLPRQGIVHDSITFYKTDAMSLDFMTRTFMARYAHGDGLASCFVSKRDTAEDAVDIRRQYIEYMENYGDSFDRRTVDGVEFAVGDLGGGYTDVIFVIDTRIAGVSGVRGVDSAVEAAKAFLAKLK